MRRGSRTAEVWYDGKYLTGQLDDPWDGPEAETAFRAEGRLGAFDTIWIRTEDGTTMAVRDVCEQASEERRSRAILTLAAPNMVIVAIDAYRMIGRISDEAREGLGLTDYCFVRVAKPLTNGEIIVRLPGHEEEYTISEVKVVDTGVLYPITIRMLNDKHGHGGCVVMYRPHRNWFMNGFIASPLIADRIRSMPNRELQTAGYADGGVVKAMLDTEQWFNVKTYGNANFGSLLRAMLDAGADVELLPMRVVWTLGYDVVVDIGGRQIYGRLLRSSTVNTIRSLGPFDTTGAWDSSGYVFGLFPETGDSFVIEPLAEL